MQAPAPFEREMDQQRVRRSNSCAVGTEKRANCESISLEFPEPSMRAPGAMRNLHKQTARTRRAVGKQACRGQ